MTSLREQQKAYAYIDELFMDKDFKIVNINELYIKLLLTYAVSEEAIIKFVNRYKIMGIIDFFEGNIIKTNEGEFKE